MIDKQSHWKDISSTIERNPKNQQLIDTKYIASKIQDNEKLPQKIKDRDILEDELFAKKQTSLLKHETEDPQLLNGADSQALLLLKKMQQTYEEDIKSFKENKMAYRKVKTLRIISQKLQNVLIRRKFLEHGGLDKFCGWMSPIQDYRDRWVEPSIALKMGIIRIVDNLKMSSLEIKHLATCLHGIIYKNMTASKIPELKEMCNLVLKSWDYTMYKQSGGLHRPHST